MAGRRPRQAGAARRGSVWRAWIVALAATLVCATVAEAICHTVCVEEQSSDQDCTVCHLGHQPAAEPPASLQFGCLDVPEPLLPSVDGECIASGSPRSQPARAPPA